MQFIVRHYNAKTYRILHGYLYNAFQMIIGLLLCLYLSYTLLVSVVCERVTNKMTVLFLFKTSYITEDQMNLMNSILFFGNKMQHILGEYVLFMKRVRTCDTYLFQIRISE